MKEFVKIPTTSILEPIKKVQLIITENDLSKEQVENYYHEQIKQLDSNQLWKLLEEVTLFNLEVYSAEQRKKEQAKELKQALKGKTKTQNYISVTNAEAAAIVASYYTSLASGSSVTTPECFRKSGLTNPTQAFNRLLFSHLFQDECDLTNSIHTSVYDYWKTNNTADVIADYESNKQVMSNFFNENPEYLPKVKDKLITKQYTQAVLKKSKA
jgi:hypothetical protein